MNTFFLLLGGFLGACLVYVLWKHAHKWYHWLLSIGLYIWVCLGISFVYINMTGYHHKAVSVGLTFFGLVAVVWAFVLARTYGFPGKSVKKEQPEKPAAEGGNA